MKGEVTIQSNTEREITVQGARPIRISKDAGEVFVTEDSGLVLRVEKCSRERG